MIELMPHQKEALSLLGNGKVLYGGVGTGKTATALAYYMECERPRDIYVITTAKKRDSLDWEGEAAKFGIGTEFGGSVAGILHVDSWNNIDKYTTVDDAFFIFDEQRLVGTGAWVKAFLKIARNDNQWIMLSATPGDVWLDYAPLFIANGWYNNLTHFKREHVLYQPYVKFPKVARYLGEAKLERLRAQVLVEMPYVKHTKRIMNYVEVSYDKALSDRIIKTRWNPFENRPVKDMGELFRLLRMISNSDPSRLDAVRMLMDVHPKLIVFYNFDYELELLRSLKVGQKGTRQILDKSIDKSCFEDNYLSKTVAEWNGHKKDPIPKTDNWVYLVQYVAGAEGWNCIETNACVLYSLTYSYKNYVQCQGRIDRLNTPYTDLYYYILESNSPMDQAVKRSLSDKKNFNENNSEVARQIMMENQVFV